MSQNRIEELEKKLAAAERRINKLVELQTKTTISAIQYRAKYYESIRDSKRERAGSMYLRATEREHQTVE